MTDVFGLNCTTETEGIQWEKAALNPLVFRWSVPFEISFHGGKTRFTRAIARNIRANPHNFKNKKFEFTYNYFPRRLLNEQRLIFVHELIVD